MRSQDIKLPDGAMFVIAHSLATKNKAASADFNCRVVECRLAAQVSRKLSKIIQSHYTEIIIETNYNNFYIIIENICY